MVSNTARAASTIAAHSNEVRHHYATAEQTGRQAEGRHYDKQVPPPLRFTPTTMANGAWCAIYATATTPVAAETKSWTYARSRV